MRGRYNDVGADVKEMDWFSKKRRKERVKSSGRGRLKVCDNGVARKRVYSRWCEVVRRGGEENMEGVVSVYRSEKDESLEGIHERRVDIRVN
jgi:hypothetical protein